MASSRVILDCTSKAMVAVSVMLSILILVGNPPVDTPSRPLAAALLAVGTLGLLALQFVTGRSAAQR